LGRFSNHEGMDIAENSLQFPPESCSMVKSNVGCLLERKAGPIKRLVVSASGCEPFNQAWEILRSEGFDMYVCDVLYRSLDVTGKRYEELVKYAMDEVYAVHKWLTGKDEIDKESLRKELERKNKHLAVFRRILELRRQHPFYMRTLPLIYLGLSMSHYFCKPCEYYEMLNMIAAEMESLPPDDEDLKKAVPILWQGAGGREYGIFHTIDEMDGFVIAWSGLAVSRDYDLAKDPVEALVRFQLGGEQGGASVFRMRSIERDMERYKARGIIHYGILGCSYQSVEREIMRNYFHSKGYINMSIEGTYQVGPPTGQMLTRIRAFMDMLI
jgi:benzoyl-CoA reductase/2-hydroxyglutaryl-CoA dehydratase subunit BcrC/BadD/HgdB